MSSTIVDFRVNPDFGRYNDVVMDTADQRAGVTAPSFQIIVGGIYCSRFDAGNSDTIFVTSQMPHTLARQYPIRPHIHFIPSIDVPIGATIKWQIEYIRARTGFVIPGVSASETMTYTRGYLIPAGMVVFASFSPISAADFGISDIFLMRLSRISSGGAADTYLGDCWLAGFDFHIQVANAGGSLRETSYE